ncbi:four helix bundle protein [bacterium]|nr:MAG: four helix bundle protein [bacterium]
MADYRKLEVWLAGRRLAVMAYRFTEALPRSEIYNLCSQIQRASVSVPANIAEGAGRGSDRDFARFVRISIGSLNELDTLIQIANDLELAPENDDLSEAIRDLAVRLRNLATRLEQQSVREATATYRVSSEQPSAIESYDSNES